MNRLPQRMGELPTAATVGAAAGVPVVLSEALHFGGRQQTALNGSPIVVQRATYIRYVCPARGTILKNRRYGGSGRHGAELA